MTVLLMGNLGAGKSFVAKIIQQQMTPYDIIAIDDYRRLYGDGSKRGEAEAKSAFFGAIDPHQDQIIESTGWGETGQALVRKFNKYHSRKVVVVLTTPLTTCIDRLRQRQWDIPYPAPQTKAYDLAIELDHVIQTKQLTVPWLTVPNTTILYYNTTTFKQIELLTQKIQSIS